MISDDTYGVLHRLILNEKILPSPEGVLRTLGFVHLYTASGLHLIALESFIQKHFVKTLAAKKVLTVLFWFFLFMIWKVQGFRLGFARVLVLFFLRALAREKGLRWRVFFPLLITFCFDMALGIDAGWKHYYLAILGGMMGIEAAQKSKRNGFVQHLYLSVGSWLMTAPLDLVEHHVISGVTPLWSMVTIPIISLFLYPLSIFFYFTTDTVPRFLVSIWNFGLESVFNLVDHGFTFWVVSSPLIWISLVFALIYIFFRHRREVFPTLVLLMLIYRFDPGFHEPLLRLAQMDVGQGDSLLIQKDQRTELLDVGPFDRKHPEAVIHRMALHGVTSVDSILLSHLDEDHSGGLRSVLPWVPVSSVELSPNFSRSEQIQEWTRDLPHLRFCSSGCFQSGPVEWISNRKGNDWKGNELKGNSLMGMVMIPLSSDTVYLALGDADVKQEKVFLNRHFGELSEFRHRFLKLSHHGSKNSSSEDFLKKVSPERVVISVGKHNRYHHPHYSVLDRLREMGISSHRTDREGDFVKIFH